MTRQFDKINKALDIEPNAIDIEVKEKKKIVNPIVQNFTEEPNNQNHDINSDYKYSRQNNYDLTSTINDAIYEMFEIAKNTQKARDFEVVGQLIKIAKELDDGYLDRHEKIKKIKDIDEMKKTNITNKTTNTVFVGSTAELQKFLKENQKNKEST